MIINYMLTYMQTLTIKYNSSTKDCRGLHSVQLIIILAHYVYHYIKILNIIYNTDKMTR